MLRLDMRWINKSKKSLQWAPREPQTNPAPLSSVESSPINSKWILYEIFQNFSYLNKTIIKSYNHENLIRRKLFHETNFNSWGVRMFRTSNTPLPAAAWWLPGLQGTSLGPRTCSSRGRLSSGLPGAVPTHTSASWTGWPRTWLTQISSANAILILWIYDHHIWPTLINNGFLFVFQDY